MERDGKTREREGKQGWHSRFLGVINLKSGKVRNFVSKVLL